MMEGQAFKMTQIRKLIEQFQTAVLDDEYMSTAYSRNAVEVSRDRLEAAFTEGDLLGRVQAATTARAKEWVTNSLAKLVRRATSLRRWNDNAWGWRVALTPARD